MVEQPIRNRQVVGSTPTLGSTTMVAATSHIRDIQLTRRLHLIYGSTVGAMTRCSGQSFNRSRSALQTAACLLLVAVLLYNPFFTILRISQDLTVQHTLSYRATVAGSELRRCTVEDVTPLVPALAAIAAHAAALSALTQTAFVQPDDLGGPSTLPHCDSTWFRPPPSA